jgi:hypothetical protein
MTSSMPQDWRAETVPYRPAGQRAEPAPVRRLRDNILAPSERRSATDKVRITPNLGVESGPDG